MYCSALPKSRRLSFSDIIINPIIQNSVEAARADSSTGGTNLEMFADFQNSAKIFSGKNILFEKKCGNLSARGAGAIPTLFKVFG